MQNFLLGVLLGYGSYWIFNTPNGRNIIRSTKTAVGQIDNKLSKVLTPEKETEEEKSLQIK